MSGIGRGDFFHHQRITDRIKTGAAEFFGYLDAHETQFSRHANGFGREFAALVEFGCDWSNFALREFSRSLANHLLFVSEFKVHVASREVIIRRRREDGSNTG